MSDDPAEATFGGELRRLRKLAGFSLRQFANRVHYSPGHLSKVENGRISANESFARLCDAELGAGGALAAMVLEGHRPRPSREAPRTRTRGLPASGRFVGRARDLARVVRAVADGETSVCAITGMAGAGKSTLAVRAALRLETAFPDGTLFLNLRGHTPGARPLAPAEALDRLLRQVGVPGDVIPADPEDRAALYRSTLHDRAVLILLDNAADSHQVLPLLPAGRRSAVLITSRNRLPAVEDALHVGLGALPRLEAIALFTAHCDPVDDHEAELVGELAGFCGDLPLAIRIAAARLQANPAWRLSDLHRRLADAARRLDELDDGDRSVAAAFAVSAAALPDERRRALELIALHPGADIDPHAVAALTGASPLEADRVLDRLRHNHLLEQDVPDRYHFHDLVRSYAVRMSHIADDERTAAMDRLLRHYVHTADRADRVLAPQRHRRDLVDAPPPTAHPISTTEEALTWFRLEWPNLVALCSYTARSRRFAMCWDLAFALRTYFFLAKLWDDWITTQALALSAAEAMSDHWAVGVAANNLGVAFIDRGDLDSAEYYYQRAFTRFTQIDEPHGISTTLANYAWVHYYRKEHQAALDNLRSALDFYKESGAVRNSAITKRGMSLAEAAIGNYGSAVELAQQALTTFHSLGLELDTAMAHNCLGWAHFSADHLAEAALAYGAALDAAEGCGSTYEAARAQTGLGNAAARAGDQVAAERHWAAAAARRTALSPLMVAEEQTRLDLLDARQPRGQAVPEPQARPEDGT